MTPTTTTTITTTTTTHARAPRAHGRPAAHKNSTSAYNALEAMLEKLGYSDVESDKVLVAMRALTRDRVTGEARFEKVTFCEFCAHLAQLVGPPSLAQYYVNDAVRRAEV